MGGIGCWLAACYPGQAGDVGYGVAVSGDGNKVEISQDMRQSEGTFVVTIHSTRGVGQASAAWWGSAPPHPLYFYLHLGGLEQFRLHWIDQLVTVSVNALDQSVIQSFQIRHQSEGTIAAGSPYWMDVTMPTPATPGYTLKAPAAFIAAAPKFWGIAWIDFYR
jgi:hypothetical protein